MRSSESEPDLRKPKHTKERIKKYSDGVFYLKTKRLENLAKIYHGSKCVEFSKR